MVCKDFAHYPVRDLQDISMGNRDRKMKLQKYMVLDTEHGFVAQALTWRGAKRKARKYIAETEDRGEIVIVTRHWARR